MRKLILSLLVASVGLSACNNDKANEEMKNPFMVAYDTPYQIPPFEQIKTEHYLPAFEQGMKEHKNDIEMIINNQDAPTFENTIAAKSRSGELLKKVSTVFYNLNSCNTNEELQQLAQKISPMLSAHYDEINLEPRLFARIKSLYDNREDLNLTAEQSYILENVYKGFMQSGANLSDEQKEELKKMNARLSTLSLAFGQNVLAETNNFEMIVENKADLAGLPESVIQAAAATASEKGYEGKWVFTTQKTSMIPFLQYAENRNLREKLYMGYTNRGNNNNEFDNKAIMAEMMNIRVKRANLLGYETHAEYVLENRMAKDAEEVDQLLKRVWYAALPVATAEREAMQQIIKKEGGTFDLKSWDWWHYAEKVRKAKYDLDDSELRPYFALNHVRDGAFMAAHNLYGIHFKEIKNVPLPHPDAQSFEVSDKDGTHLGVLFMDFHPRNSKRGGAWCGDYREHKIDANGQEVKPLVTVVCNFTKPTADKPALLNMDEVETLFHEFGHSLDALFAQNTYTTTFVARDFVELPSQMMEHWATQPEMLKMYAKHYKTDAVIPDNLIEKLENSQYFNQGFNNVEFTAAALLDMAFHTRTKAEDFDVMQFEEDYLSQLGLIPEILSRYRSTYFRHITGGYDAGYYSYMWSAVLDNDAFGAFEETSLFDQDYATKFRKFVLAQNGIADPAELYRQFRGRDPQIDALLKNRGLN